MWLVCAKKRVGVSFSVKHAWLLLAICLGCWAGGVCHLPIEHNPWRSLLLLLLVLLYWVRALPDRTFKSQSRLTGHSTYLLRDVASAGPARCCSGCWSAVGGASTGPSRPTSSASSCSCAAASSCCCSPVQHQEEDGAVCLSHRHILPTALPGCGLLLDLQVSCTHANSQQDDTIFWQHSGSSRSPPAHLQAPARLPAELGLHSVRCTAQQGDATGLLLGSAGT